MTANQIAYQNLVEQQRANRAKEFETNRSNLVNEQEAKRSHLASEKETQRSNKTRERETERHNYVSESQGWEKVVEDYRHNSATEQETSRANRAREGFEAKKLSIDKWYKENELRRSAFDSGIKAGKLVVDGVAAVGKMFGG